MATTDIATASLRRANSARFWRKSTNLLQAEAARELGVPRYLLSMIETGRITPAFDLAMDMARLYRCGIADLFPADEELIAASRE
jgi:DNA-binding XRE family transcriptional regulator